MDDDIMSDGDAEAQVKRIQDEFLLSASGGRALLTTYPHQVGIGPLGSRGDMLCAEFGNTSVWLRIEGFAGTMEEFLAEVNANYDLGDPHREEYAAAFIFLRALARIYQPKADGAS